MRRPRQSRRTRSAEAEQGSGQPDAEVVAAVDQALAAGKVDGVKWSNLRDVIADLQTVYAEQDDRLVWFDGTRPVARLEPALAAIARAGDYGLDPADYDAALLATQWPAIKSRHRPIAQRSRDLRPGGQRRRGEDDQGRACRTGRSRGHAVELRSRGENYRHRRIAAHRRPPTTTSARCSIRSSPSSRITSAPSRSWPSTRRRAQQGEPPLVPDLPKGQTKIAPGKALGRGAAAGRAIDGHRATWRPSRGGLPAPAAPAVRQPRRRARRPRRRYRCMTAPSSTRSSASRSVTAWPPMASSAPRPSRR